MFFYIKDHFDVLHQRICFQTQPPLIEHRGSVSVTTTGDGTSGPSVSSVSRPRSWQRDPRTGCCRGSLREQTYAAKMRLAGRKSQGCCTKSWFSLRTSASGGGPRFLQLLQRRSGRWRTPFYISMGILNTLTTHFQLQAPLKEAFIDILSHSCQENDHRTDSTTNYFKSVHESPQNVQHKIKGNDGSINRAAHVLYQKDATLDVVK